VPILLAEPLVLSQLVQLGLLVGNIELLSLHLGDQRFKFGEPTFACNYIALKSP
jgi:hypothetical protein